MNDGKPVDFVGSVYNQNHGPQPKRLGTIIGKNNKPEFSSSLGKVTFLNYTYLSEQLTIRYTIKDQNGKKLATIEDHPSIDGTILSRKLSVTPKTMADKVTFTQQGDFTWSSNGKQIKSLSLATPIILTTKLK